MTFTERDAKVALETNTQRVEDLWIDVQLEFKTTQDSGVLVYNQESDDDSSSSDWLKIYLKGEIGIFKDFPAGLIAILHRNFIIKHQVHGFSIITQ